MTFKQLYNRICKKLHVNNDREVEQIKDIINEQIIEFCRFKEWLNIHEIHTLTLDGSNTYNLDNILTNRCTILKIIGPDGKQQYKADLQNYRALADKSRYYAIYGGTLYLEGASGDYDIYYTSFGGDGSVTATDLFPLSTDDDEIKVTINYWDIIKQMVVVYYYEESGDVGTIQLETIRRDRLIKITSNKENREKNSGHYHNIGRS